MRKQYFGLLFFFGFSANLIAQETVPEVEPIQTDRPDQTETPAIVPKGMFQVETGFSYERTNDKAKAISAPSVLWKYGVNENFELRLITEFSSHDMLDNKISGLNPILVGFKTKLSDEKGILPKTSFIGHLMIPNLASKELKAIYFASEFRFTMQHTLTKKMNIGYNLGAEWDGESAEPSFIYTLTIGRSFTDKLGAFVEVYGFAPQKHAADHRFDGGLTYVVTNNFMLDVSGGFGLTENAPDHFVSAGFSFRL
ncbi:MAG TPA: transporter [Flavobacterium sp.]|jgi:hypothetical protein